MAAQDRTQAITSRPMANHDDFMRVRQLLIDTYPLYGTYQNWEIRRWEGQWYWGLPGDERDVLAYTHLWETAAGDLAAAVHIEGSAPGDAWFEVHPDYRHLESALLDHAEAHLAATDDNGRRTLDLYVGEDDLYRQDLLTSRGYTRSDDWEVLRRAPLADLLARNSDRPTPPDVVIRSLRHGVLADAAGWAEVVAQVFPRSQATAAIIANFQGSPAYNHDLHLIAAAPDGRFVAFAGLTVDAANGTAIFEPVGTHPDYRQRGLAAAVMVEGLRRLHALGTVATVYVGTGMQVPANALYDALGFHDVRRLWRWRRVW